MRKGELSFLKLRWLLAGAVAVLLVVGISQSAIADPLDPLLGDGSDLPQTGPIGGEPIGYPTSLGPLGTTGPIQPAPLDPLAPGQQEQVATVEQPDRTQTPVFNAYFSPNVTWAGTGNQSRYEFNPFGAQSVTLGEGKIFVISAGVPYGGGFYWFNASTNAYMSATNLSGGDVVWGRGGTYYKGDIFVSDAGHDRIAVFSPNGWIRRSIPIYLTSGLKQLLGSYDPDALAAIEPRGLDVAWGEVWISLRTRARGDLCGDTINEYYPAHGDANAPTTCMVIAVYDAYSGILKAIIPQTVQRLGMTHWQSIEAAPEMGGVFAGCTFVHRNAVLLSKSRGQLNFSSIPSCTKLMGTEAVWGMRWFQTISLDNANEPIVKEYSIDEETLSTGDVEPKLTLARSWRPKFTAEWDDTFADITYNNRDVRFDWFGSLTKSDWVNGIQCLDYVISDADIYVVYEKGEHWLEPARNFEKVEFEIDGDLKSTKTTSSGQFCFDTNTLTSGTHTLKATATVDDDRTLTAVNEKLNVDHDLPTGSINDAPSYTAGKPTLRGALDDAHSGPASWTLQILPPGSSTWEEVCATSYRDSVTGLYSCEWDTKAKNANGADKYPDGLYKARARLRDKVKSQVANEAFTPEVTIRVDNTPPTIDNMAPDLYEDAYEAVGTQVTRVEWVAEDGGSGVDNTTVDVNSSPDGSSKGAWERIGSSDDDGDTGVDWDTGERSGGLYRFRARSCDRAANCRERQWQAVMAAKAARARKTCGEDTNGDPRCYASIHAGRFGTGARSFVSYGASARIKTSLAPRHQYGKTDIFGNPNAFSASWVGLGTSVARSLQTGILTNSQPGCQKGSTETVNGRERDQYFTYIEYIDGDFKSNQLCYHRTSQGSEHLYKVDVLSGGTRASAFIDDRRMYLKLGDSPARRRKFRLQKHGVEQTQATGEVNYSQREMSGDFFDFRIQLSPDGSWQRVTDPNKSSYGSDAGYAIYFAQDYYDFCVTDRKTGGQKNCP